MEPLPVDVPPDAPGTGGDGALVKLLSDTVSMFVNAVQQKQWGMAAGIALTATVLFIRWRWKSLPPEWTPLASLVMAGAPALAVALKRPDISRVELLEATLGIWLMASGSWETIFKPVRKLGEFAVYKLRPPVPAPAPPPSPPAPPV